MNVLSLLTIAVLVIILSVLMVSSTMISLKKNYITVDWNNVRLYDKVWFEDGEFYLEDGRKVTWLDADEQKAIDYLIKITFNFSITL